MLGCGFEANENRLIFKANSIWAATIQNLHTGSSCKAFQNADYNSIKMTAIATLNLVAENIDNTKATTDDNVTVAGAKHDDVDTMMMIIIFRCECW